MSRTPPTSVRKQLRKEVNFGCPIEGCGRPYLTYHHFDPPWCVREHHSPDGMVALCRQHHDRADRGAFTVEQIRALKNHPYLEQPVVQADRLDWRRHEMLVVSNGLHYNPKGILRYMGSDIIWYTRDDTDQLLLNLEIPDTDGTSIVSLRDNDWLAVGNGAEIDDAFFSPGGNRIRIRAERLSLDFELHLREMGRDKLRGYGDKFGIDWSVTPGPTPRENMKSWPVLESQRKMYLFFIKDAVRRAAIEAAANMYELTVEAPCAWDIVTGPIRSWPITLCELSLVMEKPLRVRFERPKPGALSGVNFHSRTGDCAYVVE